MALAICAEFNCQDNDGGVCQSERHCINKPLTMPDVHEALTNFLNDIEEAAKKHGWNIGMYENLSDDKEFERVEITFIPALGYDSQFRKF